MNQELINTTIDKINVHALECLADKSLETSDKAALIGACAAYINGLARLSPSPADKLAEGFPTLARNVLELMLRHAPPPAVRKPRAKTARKATRRKTR